MKLQYLVLNFIYRPESAQTLIEADLARFRELVRAHGGSFKTDVGQDELQVLSGEGYGLLSLKRKEIPIAMATLATKPSGAALVWRELLEIYADMLRALGRSTSALMQEKRPRAVPWLGVSLHQYYVEAAAPAEVHQVLCVLWTVALCLLEQNDQTSNTELQ